MVATDTLPKFDENDEPYFDREPVEFKTDFIRPSFDENDEPYFEEESND